MPQNISWEDAVEFCDQIIELCQEVQSQDKLSAEGEHFAISVEEKVNSMKTWIEENERCTPKQHIALTNMESGLQKWIRE